MARITCERAFLQISYCPVLPVVVVWLATGQAWCGEPTAPRPAANALIGGSASEYFVAPTGSPRGNGSRQRPWPSVEFALQRVGGGHTITMLPGFYRGPITITRAAAGRPASPTIIRAEKKWETAIVGSEHHAIFCEEGAGWLVFDGLQVSGATWNGFRIQGDYCIIRDCWVHNCTHNGISAHGRTGTVVERCLIEYNGRNPTQDHGIYADGKQILVRANVIRHNAGYGIHLYPVADDCLIINNLVAGHVYRYGIIVQTKAEGGGNRVLFNTVVDDDAAIGITGGQDNLVVNNIALGRSATIMVRSSPDTKLADNFTRGDPGFVDAGKEVYWLCSGASARNMAKLSLVDQAKTAGVRISMTSEDFFGPSGRRTDVGAFQYDPALERTEARAGWVEGWPYAFAAAPETGPQQMDLWLIPRAKQ